MSMGSTIHANIQIRDLSINVEIVLREISNDCILGIDFLKRSGFIDALKAHEAPVRLNYSHPSFENSRRKLTSNKHFFQDRRTVKNPNFSFICK